MTIYGVEFCGDGYIQTAYKTKDAAIRAIIEEYFSEPVMTDDVSRVKNDIICLLTNNYIDEYAYVDEIELKD